jgi:hypothetical protein
MGVQNDELREKYRPSPMGYLGDKYFDLRELGLGEVR